MPWKKFQSIFIWKLLQCLLACIQGVRKIFFSVYLRFFGDIQFTLVENGLNVIQKNMKPMYYKKQILFPKVFPFLNYGRCYTLFIGVTLLHSIVFHTENHCNAKTHSRINCVFALMTRDFFLPSLII